jgi:nucleoside-diphosphate-sugar epimerase
VGLDLNEFRIGIVGGAGYIGSTLANSLSEIFKVKVLDVNPLPRKLEHKVEYQKCDITK